MSRRKVYVVLTALIAAGCAGAPDAGEEPAIVDAVGAAATAPGSVVPDVVLDANELIAGTPPKPICRDMFRPNSNVLETRCMSAESWKRWEQIEAQNAAMITRMLQGGKYR